MNRQMSERKLTMATVLIVAMIPALPARATERPATLYGPPFSDATIVSSMPDEWVERPIEHPTWSQTAELAVIVDSHISTLLIPRIREYGTRQGIEIAVLEGSCGVSMGLLRKKAIDIGGFCCPPKPSDRLPGLVFHTLGITPLAILVHRDNPVETLTADQIRRLFRGDLVNWAEIPTPKAANDHSLLVQAIGRLHCPQRPGHWRRILDREALFTPQLVSITTVSDMIGRTASYPGSIGFEELWNVDRYQQDGLVRPIKVNGYHPTDTEALVTGAYPFYRVHNVTTWDYSGAPEEERGLALVRYLLETVDQLDPEGLLVTPARLRQARWRFIGNELVGEPE